MTDTECLHFYSDKSGRIRQFPLNRIVLLYAITIYLQHQSEVTNYVVNGHGGNTELKRIVDTKGFDYVKKNFQYSVLENYNAKMDDHYILRREAWWKGTLCTRQYGYNKN